MEKRSLGLIETWGFVPAVEAADAGTKAADVKLLGYEVVPVGRVMVAFVGDVAAVKAAVQSGAAAAERVGEVLAVHVIPRPDRQVRVDPPSTPLMPPDGGRGPGPGTETSPAGDESEQPEPESSEVSPTEEPDTEAAEPPPESPENKQAKKASKPASKRKKGARKNESETEQEKQADDRSSDA